MTINGTVAVRDEQAITAAAGTLAIRPGQEMWTDKQKAALAVLGIKNATNADLAVFMHYCQKTGLDPFSRQIYMICRREKPGDQWVDKQTIQVGIDGFRVIRDRVAARLGIEVEYEDTIWYDADGREHAVWLSDQPPAACRVVVLKNGRRFPAVLRTSSYAATNKQGDMMAQWRTQPDHMIEKCAEAFALRRAFPHDLGGVYVEEEMGAQPAAAPAYQRVTAAEITGNGHAETVPAPPAGATDPTGGPATPQPAPPARASSGQVGIVQREFKRLGIDDRDHRLSVTAVLAGREVASTKDLTQDEATLVITRLKSSNQRDDLIELLNHLGELPADGEPEGGPA